MGQEMSWQMKLVSLNPKRLLVYSRCNGKQIYGPRCLQGYRMIIRKAVVPFIVYSSEQVSGIPVRGSTWWWHCESAFTHRVWLVAQFQSTLRDPSRILRLDSTDENEDLFLTVSCTAFWNPASTHKLKEGRSLG